MYWVKEIQWSSFVILSKRVYYPQFCDTPKSSHRQQLQEYLEIIQKWVLFLRVWKQTRPVSLKYSETQFNLSFRTFQNCKMYKFLQKNKNYLCVDCSIILI